jgi:hypothetical protein
MRGKWLRTVAQLNVELIIMAIFLLKELTLVI